MLFTYRWVDAVFLDFGGSKQHRQGWLLPSALATPVREFGVRL